MCMKAYQTSTGNGLSHNEVYCLDLAAILKFIAIPWAYVEERELMVNQKPLKPRN